VERCLGLLNKNGKLGFILPNKFFNAQYGLPLREVLSGGKHLDQIVHFGDKQVFASATTYTCLLFPKQWLVVRRVTLSKLRTWMSGGVQGLAKICCPQKKKAFVRLGPFVFRGEKKKGGGGGGNLKKKKKKTKNSPGGWRGPRANAAYGALL